MLAFRSVMSTLSSFVVRSFSTNSRPALRAAASGGRPRPAAQRLRGRLQPRMRQDQAGLTVGVAALLVGRLGVRPNGSEVQVRAAAAALFVAIEERQAHTVRET